MFGIFKKKESKNTNQPVLADIDNQPLQPGDKVESLRYELGTCELITNEEGKLVYRSLESGKEVNWALMVDASTNLQKVRKISS